MGLAEEQLLFVFLGEGADQACLGSFPGFAIDTSLGFLSQLANVLAVLLMGSMAILWCRMMDTELLQ